MDYRYRVLVVDDEPEVVEILTIALRDKYDVIPAANGLDALEKLDDFEPDLAISDVMMPLMNGWELISEVRKRPAFQHMPVIFLTALNTKKDIMAGYTAGADLYLTKPFDPLRVRKNIDVFIEKTPPPKRNRLHGWDDLDQRLKAPPAPKPEAPPVEESAPAPAPEAAELPKFDEKPRVFIVDDDEELVKILELGLGSEFEVFSANDGLEAVTKIPRYTPDIFVVDGMLPKMTGYQLCDTLRRSAAFTRAPIIFMSGKADPKTRETMRRFDLVDYLAKPFDSDQLNRVLVRTCHQPEFKPRPKKFSAEELRAEESKAAEDREQRERVKEIKESKSMMQEFIEDHGTEAPSG